ncbi:unnamed protein product [Haemonchus placei]|uniref:legumain n=1 Tax=Haemonchus placei TaxID=6290 RepID=A0A158QRE0_HAEPC|nr:unnamed protein product [Haemonchus placei]
MKVLVTISLLASVAISVLSLGRNSPKGKLYALLVAGSKGWYNYRHQVQVYPANVAHAYHVLLEHGVPAKNIIVMMYDDIANHKLNPYKGKLFNKPNGPNVYGGLKIDYKGDAVSAENFLAILKGDRDAVNGGNGRVIESNENDRIFVYYTDLGATGLIAFPTGMLMARQLNEALEEMHENRKYSQLVFYMAACESGSMFKDLLGKKINDELEFATYCEDELELPCLGDEFSVNWMEDSDKQDIGLETLDEQFEVAKGLTFQSKVSRYGNLSIADEPVGWFHGLHKDTLNKGKNLTQSHQQRISWPSRDVELLYLQKLKQLGLRPDTIDDEIFIAEENHRPIGEFFAELVYRIVHGQDLRWNVLKKRAGVTNYDCHEEVVRAFITTCSDFNKMTLLFRIAPLAALVISVASLAIPQPEGELYALLVAGSDGWWNYRHQADVSHAYHTLINHGVKPDNIIVMMVDDIANHQRNPYKGKIFNDPSLTDVYEGVVIDYKGKSVTPSNFLAILQGNKTAVKGGNGRVIHRQDQMKFVFNNNPKISLYSTANDRIFVYFSDHGGVGTISFPYERLTAKQLNSVLLDMHRKDKFGHLVFYLETCESGSMFHQILKKNINVYAVTAANPDESSYATYCYEDPRLPCLGDEFSVTWMDDTDETDITLETLNEQFDHVRDLVEESHVQRYGNATMSKFPNRKRSGTWPSRDVELMYLERMKHFGLATAEADDRISEIQKERQKIEEFFENLVDNFVKDQSERSRILEERGGVEDLDCHDDVVRGLDSVCPDISKHDYVLKFMNVLNNLCTKFNDSEKIVKAMRTTCSRRRS